MRVDLDCVDPVREEFAEQIESVNKELDSFEADEMVAALAVEDDEIRCREDF